MSNKQFTKVQEYASSELQRLRSNIAECVKQKQKLEGTPLYILVKVLETAIGKLRKDMDPSQLKFIKDCA